MANNSTYNQDLGKEEIVAKFLDEYFYPNIEIDDFERENDLVQQHKGVDLIIKHFDSTKEYVDEKAAVDYIDGDLDTFVLEIYSRSRAKDKQLGWFVREDILTNSYMIIYIKSKEEKYDINNCNDIEEIEAIWVEKKK